MTQRRFPDRAAAGSRALLRLMLYVLLPPVVFFNLARLELTAGVGAGIALGWVAIALTGVLAHVVGTRLLRLSRPETGSLIAASLHGNCGYLGLPLVAVVLGTDALDEAVAYDVLVSTPSLLLGVFGVGAAYGTGAGETIRDRVVAFAARNPPLWAAALGLAAPAALAPDILVDASRILVFALLPFGFFAVGLTLADEHLRLPPPMSRRIAAALVLRLGVAPLLLIGLAAAVIDVPTAYLVLAAMPTGLNGLVAAHAYGLDVAFSASAIAWGTAIVALAAIVIDLVAG